jgi:hypothetical protein
MAKANQDAYFFLQNLTGEWRYFYNSQQYQVQKSDFLNSLLKGAIKNDTVYSIL